MEEDSKLAESLDIDSSDIESKIGIASNIAEPVPTKKKGKLGAQKSAKKDESKLKSLNVDLRHILGFLNQTEWI